MKNNFLKKFNKNYVQTFKIIVLGLIFSSIVVFANPGGAPNNDVATPINVGPQTQEKFGAFTVGGLFKSNGKTMIGAAGTPNLPGTGIFPLEVYQDNTSYDGGAIWAGALFATQKLVAGLPNLSNVTQPNTNLDIYGNTKITSLSKLNNPSLTYPAHLCGDTNGTLIACAGVIATTPGEAGQYDRWVQGNWTLDIVPVSTTTNPGYGSTVYIELWGAGGAGGAGALENGKGGQGGGGGQAGGYIKANIIIPGDGSVTEFSGHLGSMGTTATSGLPGEDNIFSLTENESLVSNLLTAYGGQGGFNGVSQDQGGAGGGTGTWANNFPNGGKTAHVSWSNLTIMNTHNGGNGEQATDGQNCSNGYGGFPGKGVGTNYSYGGSGGDGGWHNAGGNPCNNAPNNAHHNRGISNGGPGHVKITWTATP